MRIQMMRLLNWPRKIWSGLTDLPLQLVRAVGPEAFRGFLRRQSLRRGSQLGQHLSSDCRYHGLSRSDGGMFEVTVRREFGFVLEPVAALLLGVATLGTTPPSSSRLSSAC